MASASGWLAVSGAAPGTCVSAMSCGGPCEGVLNSGHNFSSLLLVQRGRKCCTMTPSMTCVLRNSRATRAVLFSLRSRRLQAVSRQNLLRLRCCPSQGFMTDAADRPRVSLPLAFEGQVTSSNSGADSLGATLSSVALVTSVLRIVSRFRSQLSAESPAAAATATAGAAEATAAVAAADEAHMVVSLEDEVNSVVAVEGMVAEKEEAWDPWRDDPPPGFLLSSSGWILRALGENSASGHVVPLAPIRSVHDAGSRETAEDFWTMPAARSAAGVGLVDGSKGEIMGALSGGGSRVRSRVRLAKPERNEQLLDDPWLVHVTDETQGSEGVSRPSTGEHLYLGRKDIDDPWFREGKLELSSNEGELLSLVLDSGVRTDPSKELGAVSEDPFRGMAEEDVSAVYAAHDEGSLTSLQGFLEPGKRHGTAEDAWKRYPSPSRRGDLAVVGAFGRTEEWDFDRRRELKENEGKISFAENRPREGKRGGAGFRRQELSEGDEWQVREVDDYFEDSQLRKRGRGELSSGREREPNGRVRRRDFFVEEDDDFVDREGPTGRAQKGRDRQIGGEEEGSTRQEGFEAERGGRRASVGSARGLNEMEEGSREGEVGRTAGGSSSRGDVENRRWDEEEMERMEGKGEGISRRKAPLEASSRGAGRQGEVMRSDEMRERRGEQGTWGKGEEEAGSREEEVREYDGREWRDRRDSKAEDRGMQWRRDEREEAKAARVRNGGRAKEVEVVVVEPEYETDDASWMQARVQEEEEGEGAAVADIPRGSTATQRSYSGGEDGRPAAARVRQQTRGTGNVPEEGSFASKSVETLMRETEQAIQAAMVPVVARNDVASVSAAERFRDCMEEGWVLLEEGRQGVKGAIEIGLAESFLAKSIEIFERACSLDSTSLEAFGQCGNALLALGELKLKVARQLRLQVPAEPPFELVRNGRMSREEFEGRRLLRQQKVAEIDSVVDECERALVEAGRRYRRALGLDRRDARALFNWGLALCYRGQLISDEGDKEIVELADKMFLAAIDKFEAMLALSDNWRAGRRLALQNWALALRDRGRLRSISSPQRLKLMEQARAVFLDALSSDANNPQLKGAIIACDLELERVAAAMEEAKQLANEEYMQ